MCVLLSAVCLDNASVLYVRSKPVEKETVEVGCKLKVVYRSTVYIAKVKFLFLFTVFGRILDTTKYCYFEPGSSRLGRSISWLDVIKVA